MSLRGTELAVPLLGSDLGLEIARLAALTPIALPVWLITRSRPTTWAVSGAIGVVATSWAVQRALSVANPLDGVVDAALASPEWLALVLLVAASPHLVHRLVGRRCSSRSRRRRTRDAVPPRPPAARRLPRVAADRSRLGTVEERAVTTRRGRRRPARWRGELAAQGLATSSAALAVSAATSSGRRSRRSAASPARDREPRKVPSAARTGRPSAAIPMVTSSSETL